MYNQISIAGCTPHTHILNYFRSHDQSRVFIFDILTQYLGFMFNYFRLNPSFSTSETLAHNSILL